MFAPRFLALSLSCGLAMACQPAVEAPQTEGSASSTAAGSSTTSAPATETSAATTASESSDTSSGGDASTGERESTTTGATSSSSSGLSQCASPLVDPEDRLSLTGAPLRGNPDALITIVQWSSARCSFCRDVEQTLADLVDGVLGPDVRIIAKQLPLENDPDQILARSEVAAHMLGSFWEFHDALFATEGDLLDPATVDAVAVEVGLDLEAFHAARDSDEAAEQVAADIALSNALGNASIPYFIVNGASVLGAQPLDVFEDVAGEQLDAIETLINAGATPCEALGERFDAQLP